MSQQQPETEIAVPSQNPMACPFQTHPSPSLSKRSIVINCKWTVPRAPLFLCVLIRVLWLSELWRFGLVWSEKMVISTRVHIWEWYFLELPKWEEKGDGIQRTLSLAHFSVVLEKMWVWLPKGVWGNSATLWSWWSFLKAVLVEK